MQEIRECAKMVRSSSVEQTATLRAWSAVNNLNISKYRQQVENEMKAVSENKWYNIRGYINYQTLVNIFFNISGAFLLIS